MCFKILNLDDGQGNLNVKRGNEYSQLNIHYLSTLMQQKNHISQEPMYYTSLKMVHI